MRNPVRVVAAATLIAGPTALAFFSGGAFERPRVVAAIAVWVLVAVAAVVCPNPLPRGAPGRIALVALACLVAWTALSTTWAPIGQRALEDTQRLVLYLGTFLAGIALLGAPATRRWLEPGIALGSFAVTLYGLSPRLLPTVIDLERSRTAEGRLEQPLTYWNAMGCLSAIGLVLCARIAADSRRPPAIRAAAAFCGPGLGLGVYLSFSRGALLALGIGLVVLVALSPTRRPQMRSAGVLLAAGAFAALVSSRLPRVESLARGQAGDSGDGLLMLVVLAFASLAAALFTARASIPVPEPGRVPAGGQRKRVIAIALVALVLGGLASVALLEDSPSPRPGGTATSATRFGTADSTRYAFWDVALDAFASHPLEGRGSGAFAVDWRRQPDHSERAVDAHSLYIETLSELGLIGAALLGLFLGGVVVAAVRLHRRDPASAAGPAAALLAWAVHAGLDWDWEMPALTGIALLLAAATIAWDDEDLPVC